MYYVCCAGKNDMKMKCCESIHSGSCQNPLKLFEAKAESRHASLTYYQYQPCRATWTYLMTTKRYHYHIQLPPEVSTMNRFLSNLARVTHRKLASNFQYLLLITIHGTRCRQIDEYPKNSAKVTNELLERIP